MTPPTFAEVFEAIHATPPFPWQARLADEVVRNGWPELLDLPTGTGKTAALDVALYCLARAPDALPRRTVLVVDRRIVVDQGSLRSRKLLDAATAAESGPVRWLADALRALWGAEPDEPPFAIATLRGGMPRDNDWARMPHQPVLGVSTVDQVGSRLLFRGYGVHPRSASIHAGLLGNDTLILLDEVHLAVPFAQTVSIIRSQYRADVAGLPSRFGLVQMSATPHGSTSASKTFGLGSGDREDPTLRRRLSAIKKAALVEVKVTGTDEGKKRRAVAEAAVQRALALQREASARVVGLVVNRVDTAREAAALLEKHATETDARLVTGRMRPIERDHLVRTVLFPRAGAGRSRSADRPLVVVATQCIEAGADLDFDALITECASIDALRQRFGRVDRLGTLGISSSVILARSDQLAKDAEDPIYGRALAATWGWLRASAVNDEVDLGIAALGAGPVAAELLAPRADAPVLLPAHIDSWAQTSPVPSVDPDVSLWLHGPRTSADVQVVWRIDADARGGRADAVVERLLACRPSALEAVSVPIHAVRRWLTTRDASSIADVEGVAEEEENDDRRRDTDPVVFKWDGEESRAVGARDIRPGDVLIVDAGQGGGLARLSFDPAAVERVVDLGDLAQLRGRAVATLRLERRCLEVWSLPESVVASVPEGSDQDETAVELRERVRAWAGTWPDVPPAGFLGTPAEWIATRRGLASHRVRVQTMSDGSLVALARLTRSDLAKAPEVSDALTEDDDSAFRAVKVALSTHSRDVRDLCEQFCRALAFAPQIVADLSLAAWLHDVGKADPRFQRWLAGGGEVRAAMAAEPLAKSALPAGSLRERRNARRRAGYPEGYRHEILSLAMVAGSASIIEQAHDPDLVLHLVASHHGWCRPFAPPLDHPEALAVELQHGDITLAASTRHLLSRLDSGVADRFWALVERYGWWGLAWLEAVMRLADHRASELEEKGGES